MSSAVPKRTLIALAHMIANNSKYFSIHQKPLIWMAFPQLVSNVRPSSSSHPRNRDDASSDDEAENAVLSMLTEGLESPDSPPSASTACRSAPTTIQPRSSPLTLDIECDNDLKHAAYCLAETCAANGITYPPAFSWPNPWHGAANPNDNVKIPTLLTHPKLKNVGGRYFAHGTVDPSQRSLGGAHHRK